MTKAAAKRKTRYEFEHRTGEGHERSDPLISCQRKTSSAKGGSLQLPPLPIGEIGVKGQSPCGFLGQRLRPSGANNEER